MKAVWIRRLAVAVILALGAGTVGVEHWTQPATALASAIPFREIIDPVDDWPATAAAADELQRLQRAVRDLLVLRDQPGVMHGWRESFTTHRDRLSILASAVRAEWESLEATLSGGADLEPVIARHRSVAQTVLTRLESVVQTLTDAISAPDTPELSPAIPELSAQLRLWSLPFPGPVPQEVLPFGPGQGRAPVTTVVDPGAPVAVPVASGIPTPEDSSPEYALAAHMLDAVLAEAGRDLRGITKWVHDSVATQWYGGRIKGPQGVLADRQANDTDTAGLLIALLRHADIPARYGHGWAAFPLDQWRPVLGIDSLEAVAIFLASSGIEVRRLGADTILVPHTWVEAWDPESSRWVPLEAAWKAHRFAAPELSASPSFDLREYLITERHKSPVSYALKGLASASVRTPQPLPLAGKQSPLMGLTVFGPSDSWARWPDYRTGQLTLSLAGADLTLPMPIVHGQPITVTFEPSGEADRALLTDLGSDEPPPHLLFLRPIIRVGGQTVAEGPEVQAGTLQYLHLGWSIGSEPEESVRRELTAGDTLSILFVGRPVDAEEFAARAKAALRAPVDSPDDLYTLQLTALQNEYLQRVEDAAGRLAGAWGVRVAQGPRLVIAGFAVRYDSLLGVPFGPAEMAVSFDAARIAASPVVPGGASDLATLFSVALGAEAAYQERHAMTTQYDVPASSTVSEIVHEVAAGRAIAWVCRLNGDQALPSLEFSPEALAHMTTAFDRNMLVVAPRSGSELEGYVIIDPVTGASGYFITGGRNGALSKRLKLKDRMWLVDGPANVLLLGLDPAGLAIPLWWERSQRLAAARAIVVGGMDGFWAGLEGEWEGVKGLFTGVPKTFSFLWRFARDPEFRVQFISDVEDMLGELAELPAQLRAEWQGYVQDAMRTLAAHIEEISGVKPTDKTFEIWVTYYPVGWLRGMVGEIVLVAVVTGGVGKLLMSTPRVAHLVRTLRFIARNFVRLSGKSIRALFILDRLAPDLNTWRILDVVQDTRVRQYLERTLTAYLEAADLKNELTTRTHLRMFTDLAEALSSPPQQDAVYRRVSQVWQGRISAQEAEVLRMIRPEYLQDPILRELVVQMRLAIPNPTKGEALRKVLTPGQAEALIAGKGGRRKDRIGGFFTRREYTAETSTIDDLIELTRLDYHPGGLDKGAKEVFYIDFEYRGDGTDYQIPFARQLNGSIDTSDSQYRWPATTNGWLSTRNGHWVPEYHFHDPERLHPISVETTLRRRWVDATGTTHDEIYKVYDGIDWVNP